MSHESLENEAISTSEPETQTKQLRDPETKELTDKYDKEQTVRSEYRNGMSITEGKVIEGEHVGHEWLRVEGGPTIEGTELGTMILGGTSVNVEHLKFHHASVVLERGEGAGKDEKGFNSIKAEAIVTALPELAHDEESLRDLTSRRKDRAGYLSHVRQRIEDLEQMLRADLEDAGIERDAGWDAESLRDEFGRRPRP